MARTSFDGSHDVRCGVLNASNLRRARKPVGSVFIWARLNAILLGCILSAWRKYPRHVIPNDGYMNHSGIGAIPYSTSSLDPPLTTSTRFNIRRVRVLPRLLLSKHPTTTTNANLLIQDITSVSLQLPSLAIVFSLTSTGFYDTYFSDNVGIAFSVPPPTGHIVAGFVYMSSSCNS